MFSPSLVNLLIFNTTNSRAKIALLTFALLFCSFSILAQSTSPELAKRQRRKIRNEAQRYIYKGEFDKGAVLYKKLIAADSSNYALNRDLGLLLCFDMNSKAEALPYLEAAIRNTRRDTLPDLLLAIGQAYAASGQFDKAEQHLTLLKNMLESGRVIGTAKTVSVNTLNTEILQCQTARQTNESGKRAMDNIADDIVITNVGEKVNTPYPEYAPALYQGGKLMLFTTRRPDSNNSAMDTDGLFFEKMYAAHLSKDSVLKVAPFEYSDTLLSLLDNTKQHESIIMFSPDGNWLFIYKNNMIYNSFLMNGIWSKPRPMTKSLNAADYQNHITASPDGLTLIIAGKQVGGLGGLDLYESTLVNDSTWSELVMLGDSINTPGNEEGPFLSVTGDTLYFASDGLSGWGGYDLFYSVRTKFGYWGIPVNMGRPYNTPDDDIFLQWVSGDLGGLMASNRKGGQGDMDIYRVERFDIPAQEICTEYTNKKFNVVFDASASLDTNGADLVYEWMLDNGQVLGYGLKIEYTFKHPGVYDIVLNAIDTVLNVIDVRDTSLSVVIDSINHIAWASPAAIYAGDSVLLDASVSYMEGRKLKHCFWESDGMPLGVNSPFLKMSWDSAGKYIVKSQLVMTCDSCLPIRYCYTDTIHVLPADRKNKDSLLTKDQYLVTRNNKTNPAISTQLPDNSGNSVAGKDVAGNTAEKTSPNSLASVAVNSSGQNQSSSVNTSVRTVPAGAIALGPVYFDFDKSVIRADAQLILDSIVVMLKANPNAVIYIDGHTDERGSTMYNQNLSVKRANSVVKQLIKAGIARNRIIKVKALGETRPAIQCVDDTCSESNHQLNRRVELYFITK